MDNSKMDLFVNKAAGGKEKFQPKKVFRTCRRAGASKEEAEKIVKEIERKIYNGISTRKILKIILNNLKKINFRASSVYNLKEAMLELGPAGFIFEDFITRLLRNYNLRTAKPAIITGKCIEHEIDIIAEENPLRQLADGGKKFIYMIECKYHNQSGIYSGTKEALYTWARFEDLFQGYKLGKCQKFDQPWLITNTRFSGRAISYAQCKKMRLLGWAYPEKNSLNELIEKGNFYPITILPNLGPTIKNKLFEAKIIFLQDLLSFHPYSLSQTIKISQEKAGSLIKQAKIILTK